MVSIAQYMLENGLANPQDSAERERVLQIRLDIIRQNPDINSSRFAELVGVKYRRSRAILQELEGKDLIIGSQPRSLGRAGNEPRRYRVR